MSEFGAKTKGALLSIIESGHTTFQEELFKIGQNSFLNRKHVSSGLPDSYRQCDNQIYSPLKFDK